MPTLHVLFVCTGNVCRSPTAERLASAYSETFRIRDFSAASAGTRAVINSAMHAEAAEVLQRLGGDSSDFRARQLNSKIAQASDLILAMTFEHRDAILEVAPRKLHSTFTIGEVALLVTELGAQTLEDLKDLRPLIADTHIAEVPDPVGGDKQAFVDVGSQIASLIVPIMEMFRSQLPSAEA